MNEKRGLISAFLSAVGGIAGLIAIGLVIWKGGVLAQMVDAHEVRLTRIEVAGSNGLQRHEATDDARVGELQRRLDKVESLISAVARIETKLDAVKESLEEHKRTMGTK